MRTQEYILIIVRITCQTDKENKNILYTPVNQIYKLDLDFSAVNRKCKPFKAWLLPSLHFYNNYLSYFRTNLIKEVYQ